MDFKQFLDEERKRRDGEQATAEVIDMAAADAPTEEVDPVERYRNVTRDLDPDLAKYRQSGGDDTFTTDRTVELVKGKRKAIADAEAARAADPRPTVPLSQSRLKPGKPVEGADIEDARRQAIRERDSQRKIGFWESVKLELKDNPAAAIPGAGTGVELAHLGETYAAAQRVMDGTGSEDDLRKVEAFARDQELASKGKRLVESEGGAVERELTTTGKAAGIITQMPAFMGEIAMTGGTATAAKAFIVQAAKQGVKAGAKKGAKEAIEIGVKGAVKEGVEAAVEGAAKQGAEAAVKAGLVRRAVGEVAAGAAGAAMLPHRTAAAFIERRMPQLMETEDGQRLLVESDEGIAEALAKAYGDTFWEYFSERAGAYLLAKPAGAIGKMMGRFTAGQRMQMAATGAMAWLTKKKGAAYVMDKLRTAGYHGVISEWMEERVGDVGRYATGIQDHLFPSPDQLWVEAVAFAITGGVMEGASMTAGKTIDRHQENKVLGPFAEQLGMDPKEVRELRGNLRAAKEGEQAEVLRQHFRAKDIAELTTKYGMDPATAERMADAPDVTAQSQILWEFEQAEQEKLRATQAEAEATAERARATESAAATRPDDLLGGGKVPTAADQEEVLRIQREDPEGWKAAGGYKTGDMAVLQAYRSGQQQRAVAETARVMSQSERNAELQRQLDEAAKLRPQRTVTGGMEGTVKQDLTVASRGVTHEPAAVVHENLNTETQRVTHAPSEAFPMQGAPERGSEVVVAAAADELNDEDRRRVELARARREVEALIAEKERPAKSPEGRAAQQRARQREELAGMRREVLAIDEELSGREGASGRARRAVAAGEAPGGGAAAEGARKGAAALGALWDRADVAAAEREAKEARRAAAGKARLTEAAKGAVKRRAVKIEPETAVDRGEEDLAGSPIDRDTGLTDAEAARAAAQAEELLDRWENEDVSSAEQAQLEREWNALRARVQPEGAQWKRVGGPKWMRRNFHDAVDERAWKREAEELAGEQEGDEEALAHALKATGLGAERADEVREQVAQWRAVQERDKGYGLVYDNWDAEEMFLRAADQVAEWERETLTLEIPKKYGRSKLEIMLARLASGNYVYALEQETGFGSMSGHTGPLGVLSEYHPDRKAALEAAFDEAIQWWGPGRNDSEQASKKKEGLIRLARALAHQETGLAKYAPEKQEPEKAEKKPPRKQAVKTEPEPEPEPNKEPDPKPEEEPALAKARKELETKGATRVGRIDFKIHEHDGKDGAKYYSFSRTAGGIRMQKGGGHLSTWSRQHAIDQAVKEIGFDLRNSSAATEPETEPEEDTGPFKVGQRVVDKVTLRHGTITKYDPLIMTPIFGGQRSVSHYYVMETDQGAVLHSQRPEAMEIEKERPEAVVRDPVWEGEPIMPDHLAHRVLVPRDYAAKSERSAARRRNHALRKADQNKAKRHREQADQMQAVLDQWMAEHPEEAARLKIAEGEQAPEQTQGAATPAAKGASWKINARGNVEIKFPERPAQAVIDRLKAASFRWAPREKVWYADRSEAREALAKELTGESDKAAQAEDKPPPEKARRFNIGDTVRPKPGGGVTDRGPGKIEHINRYEGGEEHIKVQGYGGAHWKAEDWELVQPAEDEREPAPAPKPVSQPAPKPAPRPAPQPAPQPAPKKGITSNLSAEKQAELARLTAQWNKKIQGEVRSGAFDPELVAIGARIGFLYMEAGAREFGQWAGEVLAGVGESIRPYLKSIYEFGRNMPDSEAWRDELTPAVEVAQFDIDAMSEGNVILTEEDEDNGRDGGRGGDRDSQNAGETGDSGEPETGSGDGGEAGAGGNEGTEDPAGSGSGVSDSAGDHAGASGRDGGRSPVKKDYVLTDADEIGRGGAKQKFQDNVAAIRVLKVLEAEERPATDAEKRTLVRYSGWGGIAEQVFGWNRDWERERNILGEILTDEEYDSAKRSTPNAHFTSPTVIGQIWAMLDRLGFGGGRVLEPSAGVGHFLGLQPTKSAAGSARVAVELDSISARIVQKVYERVDVRATGFQEANLPSNWFDLAVSNIPFGNYPVDDPSFGPDRRFLTKAIHNYFFGKALDVVRPGGFVVFVTSHYTMDGKISSVREYLASKADLVAALRLPNSAFKGNALTEVTTDILILRKREEGQPPSDVRWTKRAPIAIGGSEYEINEYFAAHPEQMMGTPSLAGTMYGGKEEFTLEPGARPLDEQMADAIDRLPEGLYQKPPAARPEPIENLGEAIKRLRERGLFEGSYVVENGILHQVVEGKLIPQQKTTPTGARSKVYARIEGMVKLRDQVQHLINLMNEDVTDEALRLEQRKLDSIYTAFVKKHGLVNLPANLNAFHDDPHSGLVLGLERFDKATKEYVKGDIFTKRTIQRFRRADHAENAEEALLIAVAETGEVDFARIGELTGQSEAEAMEALGELVFREPSGRWVMAEEYLTGDVKAKLADARAAAAMEPTFERNVKALEAAQPARVPIADITLNLGASWIEPEIIQAFTTHLVGDSPTINYFPALGQWEIGPEPRRIDWEANEVKWGRGYRTALSLLDSILNGRTIVVKVQDVVDQERTLEAREAAGKIREEFDRWARATTEIRARLEDTYNDRFNNIVPRQFDGSKLTLPGMNPAFYKGGMFSLRPHQRNAIYRMVHGGNVLMAHAVGAGKTFATIGGIMERRRLGLTRKPVIAVPKNKVDDWANDWMLMYPGAKVLVVPRQDLSNKALRRRRLLQIMTGDWDAVILSHEAFGKIPVSTVTQRAFIDEQLRTLDQYLWELKAEKADKKTIKEIEKAKQRLQVQLKKLMRKKAADEELQWEKLGIDYVAVDEAHNFKNLWFPTRRTRLSGVGGNNGSNRAFDLFIKLRELQRLNGGRGSVTLATGTPISNTMGELFTMQRYLQMEELESRSLDHFDSWADTFGSVVADVELDPTGGRFRIKERFKRFFNIPELGRIARRMMDVVLPEDMDLPIPKIKGGKPEFALAPPTEALKRYVQWLGERADHLPMVEPKDDNMLLITSHGRHAGLDLRLVLDTMPAELRELTEQEMAEGKTGGKIRMAVDRVFKIWERTQKERATQLIFCDLSAPKEGYNVYDAIRTELIARGVPAAEIAFMQSAKGKQAKLFEIQEKVRAGEIRILLGSTAMMGEGVNVQERLVALHHLDAPWKPAHLEQRNGRILRQGNRNAEVEIVYYASEGSFDSYMWQTVENKKRFIDQFMKAKEGVREIEDISAEALTYAELKALVAGQPEIMERVKIDNELLRLRALQRAFADRASTLRHSAEHLESRNREHRAQIEKFEKTLEAFAARPADGKFTIGGKEFEKANKEAGEALGALVLDEEGKFKKNQMDRIVTLRGREAWYEAREGKWESERKVEFFPEGNATLSERIGVLGVKGAETPLGLLLMVLGAEKAFTKAIESEKASLEQNERRIEAYREELKQSFQHADQIIELEERRRQVEAAINARAGNGPREQVLDPDAAEGIAEEEPAEEEDEDAEDDEEDGRRYSTRLAPARGMKAARVELVIAPMKRRWKNGPKTVRVVQSVGELPGPFQGDGRRGVYDPATDTVWIVADNLDSAEEAAFVALHEVIGHRGLEAMLGAEANGWYLKLWTQRLEEVRQYAREQGIDTSTMEGKRHAAREWLADRAAHGDLNQTWFQRLAAAIRRAWAKLTGRGEETLTDDQLAALVRGANRYTRRGPKPPNGGGARFSGEPQPSEPVTLEEMRGSAVEYLQRSRRTLERAIAVTQAVERKAADARVGEIQKKRRKAVSEAKGKLVKQAAAKLKPLEAEVDRLLGKEEPAVRKEKKARSINDVVRWAFELGTVAGHEKGAVRTAEDIVAQSFRRLERELKRDDLPGWMRVLKWIETQLNDMDVILEREQDPKARKKAIQRFLRGVFGGRRYMEIRRATRGDIEKTYKHLRKYMARSWRSYYSQGLRRLVARTDPKKLYNDPGREGYDLGDQWQRLTRNYQFIDELSLALKRAMTYRKKIKKAGGATPQELAEIDQKVLEIQKRLERQFEAIPYKRLRDLFNALASLKAQSDFLQEEIIKGHRIRRGEAAAVVAAEIERNLAEMSDEKAAVTRGMIKNMLVDWRGDAETMALTLSGGDRNSPVFALLYEELRKADTASMTAVARVHRRFMGVLERLGYDLAAVEALKGDERPFKIHGATHRFTTAQIMDLYLLAKDIEALPKLLRNGFKDENKRQKNRIHEDIIQSAENEEDLIRIVTELVGQLSPTEKLLADAMHRMVNDMAAAGNRTSLRLWGQEKFTNTTYWPISVDVSDTMGARVTDLSEVGPGYSEARVDRMGMLIGRVSHGHPLLIRDVFDVFDDHVLRMADFTHQAIPTLDAINILNNALVADAMVRRVGSRFGRIMRERIARQVHLRHHSDKWGMIQRTMAVLHRNITTAILGFRITSITNNLVGGAALMAAELQRESPALAAQYAATFPTDLVRYMTGGTGLREMLHENGYLYHRWEMDLARVYANLPTDESRVHKITRLRLRRWQQIALQGMSMAEQINAMHALDVLLKNGYSKSDALDIVEKATRRTQNPSSALEESNLYTAIKESAAANFFFPFYGQPSVASNLIMRDAMEMGHAVRSGRDTGLAARNLTTTLGAMMINNIFASAQMAAFMALGYGLFTGGGDDEDKARTMQFALGRFFGDMLDNILPGIGYFTGDALGEVATNHLMGKRTNWGKVFLNVAGGAGSSIRSPIALSVIDRMIWGVEATYQGITEDDASQIFRGALNMVDSVSMAFGLPTGGATQLLRAGGGAVVEAGRE